MTSILRKSLLSILGVFIFQFSVFGQIEILNFSAEHLPIGFHAITAEDGVVIVTFPEEGKKWKSNCYKPSGKLLWERELEIALNEHIIQDELHNGVLSVFSTIKDDDSMQAILMIRRLDVKSGEIIEKRELWRTKVEKENFNLSKADVIADEETALMARRGEEVEVDLEYRYNMYASKNNSRFLFYIYDFSKPHLILNYKIYDQEINEIKSDTIQLPDLQFVYEVKLNNLGDIFISNSNMAGDLELRKHPFDTGEVHLLDILAISREMSDIKDDLTMEFIDDQRVLLACKTEFEEIFLGMLYGIFDFENNRIDRERFQPISIELLSKVDSLRKAKIIKQVVWNKYNLTHLKVFNDGDIFFVFEHMDIRHSGHIFRELDFVSQLPWKKINSRIEVGPALIFSFNNEDVLNWSRYFDTHLETTESVFPLSSLMYVEEPKKDMLEIIVREDESSYTYNFEYNRDSQEEKIEFNQEGSIIPAWTVSMNKKYYAPFYSDETKTLKIIELK